MLANLRRTLDRWGALADDLAPDDDLAAFLRRGQYALADLYRARHTFSELRHRKGYVDHAPTGPIANALPRVLHVDDPDRLAAFQRFLTHKPAPDRDDPHLRQLFALLGYEKRPLADLPGFVDDLWADPVLRLELRDLFAVLEDQQRHETWPIAGLPLRAHATYSRAEILAALGVVNQSDVVYNLREGVYKSDLHRCDLFFVTLDKDERDFTPTTLYQDYPISPTRFHWQSQSGTREDSATGRRYREAPEGWRFFLFVRRAKREGRGETCPFLCQGPSGDMLRGREVPRALIAASCRGHSPIERVN